MEKLTTLEHNVTTGEVIEREMTEAEIEAFNKSLADTNARLEAQAQKAAAKQALLDKLGITAEEAQLLLGGN
jgi:hypothetical protein